MQTSEEQDWITSAQNGDLQGFERLARKYQHMIYRICLRILKNSQDAEDVSQEVLIKMYKSISTYRVDASFSAWVYRISYNESMNKIKQRKRTRVDYEEIDTDRENWMETKNVLDTLEASERKNIILLALDQLSEEDRIIIMAYYFDELSIQEVCELTGLGKSNVKVKLHRSRKQLFKLLNQDHIKEKLIL